MGEENRGIVVEKAGVAEFFAELFEAGCVEVGVGVDVWDSLFDEFGADLREIKKCGMVGVVSLLMGVVSSFFVGAALAYFMGYPDVVSMVTIGGGVCTFVVGPVTGAALGASSEVIAIL